MEMILHYSQSLDLCKTRKTKYNDIEKTKQPCPTNKLNQIKLKPGL